jgi:hypothetical protein
MNTIKEAVITFTQYKQSIIDKYLAKNPLITNDEDKKLKDYKFKITETCKQKFIKDWELHIDLSLTKPLEEIISIPSIASCAIEAKTFEWWIASLKWHSSVLNKNDSRVNASLLTKAIMLRDQLIDLCQTTFK